MITYEWRPELTGAEIDEVLQLVQDAAEYDEEAGFSSIDADTVREVGGATGTVAHLPIKARRDLSPLDDVPLVIVAYLHLSVAAAGRCLDDSLHLGRRDIGCELRWLRALRVCAGPR